MGLPLNDYRPRRAARAFGGPEVRFGVRTSEDVANLSWDRQAPSWPTRCKEIW